MFSHVIFGVNDSERSKRFYDALLGTLGIGPGVANKNRYFYRSPAGTFCITTPIDGAPATHGNGSTLGFALQSVEQGEAWHAAGVANGGAPCEDPPGFRESPAGKTAEAAVWFEHCIDKRMVVCPHLVQIGFV